MIQYLEEENRYAEEALRVMSRFGSAPSTGATGAPGASDQRSQSLTYEGQQEVGGEEDLRTQLEDDMAALAPEWERTAAWPGGPAVGVIRDDASGSQSSLCWWWYHKRRGPGQDYFDLVRKLGPPPPMRPASFPCPGDETSEVGAYARSEIVAGPCPCTRGHRPEGGTFPAVKSQYHGLLPWGCSIGSGGAGQLLDSSRQPLHTVFDVNRAAAATDYFDVGTMTVSPDGGLVDVTVDLIGDEK